MSDLTVVKYLENLGFDEAHLPEIFNGDDKSYYKVSELMEAYHVEKQANEANKQPDTKALRLKNVSGSASKKGTGTYMIVMTLISAACAGMVGYGFKSLDAALAVGLFINIALNSAVRFNQ